MEWEAPGIQKPSGMLQPVISEIGGKNELTICKSTDFQIIYVIHCNTINLITT